MADTWDADGIALSKIKRDVIDDDDVLDNWEDEPPEPEPEPEKPKDLPKPKSKPKKTNQIVDDRELTEEEKKQRQRDSDLQISKSLFGCESEEAPPIDLAGPAQIETSAKDLRAHIEQACGYTKKTALPDNYVDFLSKLFKELTLDLPSEAVKRFGKELTLIGTQLHKTEQEEKKKAAASSKKKIQLNVKKNASDFGDYFAGEADADDDQGDEDFM